MIGRKIAHAHFKRTAKANKRYKKKIKRQQSFFAFIVSALSGVTLNQWLLVAIIILLLVKGNRAADAQAIKVEKTEPSDINRFREICLQPANSLNNPGVTIAARDGKLGPLSCLLNQNTCKSDIATLDKRDTNNAEIKSLRTIFVDDYIKWDARFKEQANELFVSTQGQNPRYREAFQTLCDITSGIVHIKKLSNAYKFLGKGYCGEISAFTIMELLAEKINFNSELSIQLVHCKDGNHLYQDHAFLIIDKSGRGLPAVEISSSKIEVAQYLEQLKGSQDLIICDRWNKVFVTGKEDITQLYSPAANWGSINVYEPYDININNIKKLPKELQKFICDTFFDIGLIPKHCHRFFKSVDLKKNEKLKHEQKVIV